MLKIARWGALFLMFVIGVVFDPHKPALAGIPSTTKGGAPKCAVIISITDPAHNKERMEAAFATSSFLDRSEGRQAVQYEDMGLSGLQNAGYRVVWLFPLVWSSHRQSPLACENFDVGFSNLSFGITDVADVGLPKDILLKQRIAPVCMVNDDIPDSKPGARYHHKLTLGNLGLKARRIGGPDSGECSNSVSTKSSYDRNKPPQTNRSLISSLISGADGGICRPPLLAKISFFVVTGVFAIWSIIAGLLLLLFDQPTWMSRPGWWDRQHIKLRRPKVLGWWLFICGIIGAALGPLTPLIFSFCYSGPQ